MVTSSLYLLETWKTLMAGSAVHALMSCLGFGIVLPYIYLADHGMIFKEDDRVAGCWLWATTFVNGRASPVVFCNLNFNFLAAGSEEAGAEWWWLVEGEEGARQKIQMGLIVPACR